MQVAPSKTSTVYLQPPNFAKRTLGRENELRGKEGLCGNVLGPSYPIATHRPKILRLPAPPRDNRRGPAGRKYAVVGKPARDETPTPESPDRSLKGLLIWDTRERTKFLFVPISVHHKRLRLTRSLKRPKHTQYTLLKSDPCPPGESRQPMLQCRLQQRIISVSRPFAIHGYWEHGLVNPLLSDCPGMQEVHWTPRKAVSKRCISKGSS